MIPLYMNGVQQVYSPKPKKYSKSRKYCQSIWEKFDVLLDTVVVVVVIVVVVVVAVVVVVVVSPKTGYEILQFSSQCIHFT